MPPTAMTATLDDIKAYQKRVEKDEITPHDLSPCPVCNVKSIFFKIHAYRERRFLVVIEALIKSVYCPLIRFRCPGCGTTRTYYPDFALPRKHYTRQSIMSHAGAYVESETSTYEQSAMADNGLSGYPDSDKALAPSTIHRWVTTLGGFTNTCQKALSLILQQNPVSSVCRDLAGLNICKRKYRTQQRKTGLLGCLRLVIVEALFSYTFKISIFTKLAIICGFSSPFFLMR